MRRAHALQLCRNPFGVIPADIVVQLRGLVCPSSIPLPRSRLIALTGPSLPYWPHLSAFGFRRHRICYWRRESAAGQLQELLTQRPNGRLAQPRSTHSPALQTDPGIMLDVAKTPMGVGCHRSVRCMIIEQLPCTGAGLIASALTPSKLPTTAGHGRRMICSYPGPGPCRQLPRFNEPDEPLGGSPTRRCCTLCPVSPWQRGCLDAARVALDIGDGRRGQPRTGAEVSGGRRCG